MQYKVDEKENIKKFLVLIFFYDKTWFSNVGIKIIKKKISHKVIRFMEEIVVISRFNQKFNYFNNMKKIE